MKDGHRINGGAAVFYATVNRSEVVQLDRLVDSLQRFVRGDIQPSNDCWEEPVIKFPESESFEYIIVVK